MARSEEGEFELVVGTRQLLTLVFILMVLFGVVFSMGYFVGRSSVTEAPADAAARQPASATPGSPPAASNESAWKPAPGSPLSSPEPTGQALSPAQPGAAAPTTTPVGGAPTEAAKAPATAPSQRPSAAPTSIPSPAAPAAKPPAPAEPAPGQTFLQVAAVARAEAELIVDVLKKKGFPALIAPVPGDARFRALVGPLTDTATVNKTKADLEQAGFRSILRKY